MRGDDGHASHGGDVGLLVEAKTPRLTTEGLEVGRLDEDLADEDVPQVPPLDDDWGGAVHHAARTDIGHRFGTPQQAAVDVQIALLTLTQ